MSDFPYSNSVEGCLNTVAARTIYRLFADNLFVTALTFHGGFKTAITYPWASNHVEKDTPDFQAFNTVGLAMKEAAGGKITIPRADPLEEFEVGDVSTTLYQFSGTVTDWAYAAGWESSDDGNAVLDECIPNSKPELPEDFFTSSSTENVRTAIFKIETDPNDAPPVETYGKRGLIRFNDGSGEF